MADVTEPSMQVRSPVVITIHHRGESMRHEFEQNATLIDLSLRISEELGIPPSHQKFLISPRPGLVKPPFDKPELAALALSTVSARKITLLGSTLAEVDALNKASHDSQSKTQRRANGPIKPATPARSRNAQQVHDDATYTFLQCRPLAHLPGPERSLRFLERLRDDAGVRACMRKHKWSVPLLTEMNPAEHTTHESRTLGLNRNAGEVIELRLRTDAYDGYRDYRTIRRTLCHELAHNVWGEHDRNFWDLCRQVEREVEAGDWRSGGKALTSQEFYEPSSGAQEVEVADHGAWTGGEFVLGGGSAVVKGAPASAGAAATVTTSMSRREILAKAAEERMKRQQAAREDP